MPYIGEVLIQDINNDGRVIGANIKLIDKVCEAFPESMPIHIGSCGLVTWSQYAELLKIQSVNAVSVTNVHHMSFKAMAALRDYCKLEKLNIRTPCFIARDA